MPPGFCSGCVEKGSPVSSVWKHENDNKNSGKRLWLKAIWLCCSPVESRHPKSSGPRLNIKTVLSTYGDFHVKDKTAVRTSYL